MILSGTTAAEQIARRLQQEIESLEIVPTLAIVQVGSLPDSNVYIKRKMLFAEKIGARTRHIQLESGVSEADLISTIESLNADNEIQGIIVQIPLPREIDTQKIIETIALEKDVDGLRSHSSYIPATARGILSLLEFYEIPVAGKRVVIVGQSMFVGAPTAEAFRNLGALVSVADEHTNDLAGLTCTAEILVVAIGDPKFIKREHVSEGQVVVDVGINSVEGHLVGDVDFESVEKIVGSISPVPGGVGPMTVLALFENLVDARSKSELS